MDQNDFDYEDISDYCGGLNYGFQGSHFLTSLAESLSSFFSVREKVRENKVTDPERLRIIKEF